MPSNPAPGGAPVVRLEMRGRVALLLIDNPPVNATSQAVRAGLLAALERLAEDQDVRAIVLAGAGKTFVAGADIKEFGKPLAEPQSPAVIRAIEAAPQPVVAAIQGAALGGGLELALGCDLRLAAADAVLGLPEIGLGFIPGNGGTQRLPRLTGLGPAIDLVTSGRRIDATEAEHLGIVDGVVEGEVVAAALALAEAGGLTKRRVRDLPLPAEPPEAVAAARTRALQQLPLMPWVADAIEVMEMAATTPVDAALARERAVFQRLRLSEPALALRHLFFAERAAGKVEGLKPATRPIERAAVIGGGLMGSGIAFAMLRAGLPVTLVERDETALEAALARLRDLAGRAVAKGRIAADAPLARLAGLTPTVALTAVADADLVLEAVVEDMAVKRGLFQALGRLAAPHARLASNTSYLDLDELARASGRPAACLGLHFFSPAQAQKLLEVVEGRATGAATLAAGLDLARRLGKLPVVVKAAPGFVGNAIFSDYRRTVERLVEQGSGPAEVDAAMAAFGMAMGPFRVFDMAGLDIAWRARRVAAPATPPGLADRLCEAGRFGQKTGAGWYRYAPGSRTPLPDPAVDRLLEEHARERGITRMPMPAETITRLALAAMLNRSALLLARRIARRPGDIDVVMVNGYGFPRNKGGPLFWASRQDQRAILEDQAELAGLIGKGFERGDVRAMLEAVRTSD